MKTVEELYAERLDRITKAINLEKPDRIPIMLTGPGMIKYGDPKAVMADYIRRPMWAADTVLKAYRELEDIDAGAAQGGGGAMGAFWLCKVKLPGRELPEDAIWQLEEVGYMTEEDYDTVVDKGWAAVTNDILINRIGYTPEELAPNMEEMMYSINKAKEQGLVSLMGGGMVIPPYETLSAARSIGKFMKDLHRMPDKVMAAMEVMEKEAIEGLKQAMRANKGLAAFHGNSRAGDNFISRKMFEKFAWPYLKRIAEAIIEEDTKVFFHIDSTWDERLPYFLEFPRATTIFDPDSATNIFKIKEILGDNMCITGDVPPAMLSLGTPDEVYRYARRLCEEIGPVGFIMSQGCAMPPNAKPENIKAIVDATVGR
ncbi:MAG: uroporphyrinogen-III decarboxylase [Eubacteriales bacterium]|nr:uroporphyrinogen-III decarboxylase [Eubacteriales bacterium]